MARKSEIQLKVMTRTSGSRKPSQGQLRGDGGWVAISLISLVIPLIIPVIGMFISLGSYKKNVSFAIGALIPLLPLLLLAMGWRLYDTKSRSRQKCSRFLASFFSDGDSLWYSITLLSTSIAGVLIGNSSNIDDLIIPFILSGLTVFIAYGMFVLNISDHFPEITLVVVSHIIFIFCMILSYFITIGVKQ